VRVINSRDTCKRDATLRLAVAGLDDRGLRRKRLRLITADRLGETLYATTEKFDKPSGFVLPRSPVLS